MAQFFSDTRFDFREFNLQQIIAPLSNVDVFYDRVLTLTPLQLPGLQGSYRSTDALGYFDGNTTLSDADNFVVFSGDNFSFNASRVPTAGTVTGMFYSTTTTAGVMGMAAIGIAVSTISVYNAARSLSTTDDRALLLQMLRGQDRLNGSPDADYMFGAAGHDSLFGNLGNDTLLGDVGNDLLYGGTGNDMLMGGVGADTINGGNGKDRLYGGSDTARDEFVFATATESANSTARDAIYNFTRGIDDISLLLIDANTALSGNQAFGWGGKTAGTNDLWFTLSGGNATVYADVNGDARADFSVILVGVSSLASVDFLL